MGKREIIMRRNQYAEELNKRVESVEKKHGDYISYVLSENFSDIHHIMVVEEDFQLEKVYNELKDLEKADLIDYFKKEQDERPNKKRRNLLC